MGKVKYNKKTGQIGFGKISAMADMQMITENGLVQNGRRYSLYYRLECKGRGTGLFGLLRFYDIPFRLLIDMEGHCACLGICEEYDSMAQAENDLGILEEDIIKNLPAGCAMQRLNMHNRMSLLQKMCAGDSAYINTENFQRNGDWVNDICLKPVSEQTECLVFGSEYKNSYRISAYKKPETLPQSGRLPEDVRYVLLDYGNISNHAVKLFMEENYLGLNDIERSIEKRPVLHEVLFAPEKEDTRLYTLAGVYVVQSSKDSQFAGMQGLEVNSCGGMQKGVFRTFLPSGFAGVSQMRVCESSRMRELTDWALEKGGIC